MQCEGSNPGLPPMSSIWGPPMSFKSEKSGVGETMETVQVIQCVPSIAEALGPLLNALKPIAAGEGLPTFEKLDNATSLPQSFQRLLFHKK